jgi:hypothetical protein
MKYYKTENIHVEQSKLEKTTCDLCGEVIEKKRYSAEQVTVEYRTGSSFPECGWGNCVEVDMCPDCFKERLQPWLESQGCTLKNKEWQW